MARQDEILNQIETLLESLRTTLTDLTQDHTHLLEHEKFIEAEQIKNKSEEIQSFHARVKALYDDWLNISLPTTPTKLRQKTIPSQKPTNAPKPGSRTPKQAFQLPILQALVHLGGSAPLQTVLDRVHQIIKDQLSTDDYQSLPSNPHVVRWENNAQWARFKLVKEGYLAADSPRGTWEITEAGRKRVLEANPEMGTAEDESEYQSEPFDFEDEN